MKSNEMLNDTAIPTVHVILTTLKNNHGNIHVHLLASDSTLGEFAQAYHDNARWPCDNHQLGKGPGCEEINQMP